MDAHHVGAVSGGVAVALGSAGHGVAVDGQLTQAHVGPDDVEDVVLGGGAVGGGDGEGHRGLHAVGGDGQDEAALGLGVAAGDGLLGIAAVDGHTDHLGVGGHLDHPGLAGAAHGGDPQVLQSGLGGEGDLAEGAGGHVAHGDAGDGGVDILHILQIHRVGFADGAAVGGGDGEGVAGGAVGADGKVLEHAAAHLALHHRAVGAVEGDGGHAVVGHHGQVRVGGVAQNGGVAAVLLSKALPLHIHAVDTQNSGPLGGVHGGALGLVIDAHGVHLLALAGGGDGVEVGLVHTLAGEHLGRRHGVAQLAQSHGIGHHVVPDLRGGVAGDHGPELGVGVVGVDAHVHIVHAAGDGDLIDGRIVLSGGGLTDDVGCIRVRSLLVDDDDLAQIHAVGLPEEMDGVLLLGVRRGDVGVVLYIEVGVPDHELHVGALALQGGRGQDIGGLKGVGAGGEDTVEGPDLAASVAGLGGDGDVGTGALDAGVVGVAVGERVGDLAAGGVLHGQLIHPHGSVLPLQDDGGAAGGGAVLGGDEDGVGQLLAARGHLHQDGPALVVGAQRREEDLAGRAEGVHGLIELHALAVQHDSGDAAVSADGLEQQGALAGGRLAGYGEGALLGEGAGGDMVLVGALLAAVHHKADGGVGGLVGDLHIVGGHVAVLGADLHLVETPGGVGLGIDGVALGGPVAPSGAGDVASLGVLDVLDPQTGCGVGGLHLQGGIGLAGEDIERVDLLAHLAGLHLGVIVGIAGSLVGVADILQGVVIALAHQLQDIAIGAGGGVLVDGAVLGLNLDGQVGDLLPIGEGQVLEGGAAGLVRPVGVPLGSGAAAHHGSLGVDAGEGVTVHGDHHDALDGLGVHVNGHLDGVGAALAGQHHHLDHLLSLAVHISDLHPDGSVGGHLADGEEVVLIGSGTIQLGGLDPQQVDGLVSLTHAGGQAVGAREELQDMGHGGLVALVGQDVGLVVALVVQLGGVEEQPGLSAQGLGLEAGVVVGRLLKDQEAALFGVLQDLGGVGILVHAGVGQIHAQLHVGRGDPDGVDLAVLLVGLLQQGVEGRGSHLLLLGTHGLPASLEPLHLAHAQAGQNAHLEEVVEQVVAVGDALHQVLVEGHNAVFIGGQVVAAIQAEHAALVGEGDGKVGVGDGLAVGDVHLVGVVHRVAVLLHEGGGGVLHIGTRVGGDLLNACAGIQNVEPHQVAHLLGLLHAAAVKLAGGRVDDDGDAGIGLHGVVDLDLGAAVGAGFGIDGVVAASGDGTCRVAAEVIVVDEDIGDGGTGRGDGDRSLQQSGGDVQVKVIARCGAGSGLHVPVGAVPGVVAGDAQDGAVAQVLPQQDQTHAHRSALAHDIEGHEDAGAQIALDLVVKDQGGLVDVLGPLALQGGGVLDLVHGLGEAQSAVHRKPVVYVDKHAGIEVVCSHPQVGAGGLTVIGLDVVVHLGGVEVAGGPGVHGAGHGQLGCAVQATGGGLDLHAGVVGNGHDVQVVEGHVAALVLHTDEDVLALAAQEVAGEGDGDVAHMSAGIGVQGGEVHVGGGQAILGLPHAQGGDAALGTGGGPDVEDVVHLGVHSQVVVLEHAQLVPDLPGSDDALLGALGVHGPVGHVFHGGEAGARVGVGQDDLVNTLHHAAVLAFGPGGNRQDRAVHAGAGGEGHVLHGDLIPDLAIFAGHSGGQDVLAAAQGQGGELVTHPEEQIGQAVLGQGDADGEGVGLGAVGGGEDEVAAVHLAHMGVGDGDGGDDRVDADDHQGVDLPDAAVGGLGHDIEDAPVAVVREERDLAVGAGVAHGVAAIGRAVQDQLLGRRLVRRDAQDLGTGLEGGGGDVNGVVDRAVAHGYVVVAIRTGVDGVGGGVSIVLVGAVRLVEGDRQLTQARIGGGLVNADGLVSHPLGRVAGAQLEGDVHVALVVEVVVDHGQHVVGEGEGLVDTPAGPHGPVAASGAAVDGDADLPALGEGEDGHIHLLGVVGHAAHEELAVREGQLLQARGVVVQGDEHVLCHGHDGKRVVSDYKLRLVRAGVDQYLDGNGVVALAIQRIVGDGAAARLGGDTGGGIALAAQELDESDVGGLLAGGAGDSVDDVAVFSQLALGQHEHEAPLSHLHGGVGPLVRAGAKGGLHGGEGGGVALAVEHEVIFRSLAVGGGDGEGHLVALEALGHLELAHLIEGGVDDGVGVVDGLLLLVQGGLGRGQLSLSQGQSLLGRLNGGGLAAALSGEKLLVALLHQSGGCLHHIRLLTVEPDELFDAGHVALVGLESGQLHGGAGVLGLQVDVGVGHPDGIAVAVHGGGTGLVLDDGVVVGVVALVAGGA